MPSLTEKQLIYNKLHLVAIRLIIEGDYEAAKRYVDIIIGFDWSTS